MAIGTALGNVHLRRTAKGHDGEQGSPLKRTELCGLPLDFELGRTRPLTRAGRTPRIICLCQAISSCYGYC